MPNEDKNLRETLADVVKGQKSVTQDAKVDETNTELSKGASSETEAGETLEEYQGIPLSDVPAQDRPRIKKFLEEKFKLADVGINKKFQAEHEKLKPLKQALEDITQQGLTIEEAREAVIERATKKRNPQLNKEEKKTLKLLDQLIESQPSEQKESLRQLRQITQEEAEEAPVVKQLRGELDEIRKVLGLVTKSALDTKKREIETELDTTFSEKLGKEFIGKHREHIVEIALKNPNVPLIKVIKYETPDDEYEQAILSKQPKGKPLTEEKKNAITNNASSVNSSEKVDTKQSYKGLFMDLLKK